jgi:hypothetical protein
MVSMTTDNCDVDVELLLDTRKVYVYSYRLASVINRTEKSRINKNT